MKNDLILKQAISIIDNKVPLVSNLSNVSSILNEMDNINWVGFYLVGKDYLYLGPFQGSSACTIIPFDKGVCGKSAYHKETIIVEDVNKFEGHIACSSTTKSEIVVPIIKDDIVYGVIDIDSEIYSGFDQNDANILKKVADILANLFYENNKSK